MAPIESQTDDMHRFGKSLSLTCNIIKSSHTVVLMRYLSPWLKTNLLDVGRDAAKCATYLQRLHQYLFAAKCLK